MVNFKFKNQKIIQHLCAKPAQVLWCNSHEQSTMIQYVHVHINQS
jgi:hypothetical protein